MARQKKVYNSVDSKTNRHQTRGGGMTTPKRKVKKRYQTQPVETPVSPTWLAARAAKKLNVKTLKPLNA